MHNFQKTKKAIKNTGDGFWGLTAKVRNGMSLHSNCGTSLVCVVSRNLQHVLELIAVSSRALLAPNHKPFKALVVRILNLLLDLRYLRHTPSLADLPGHLPEVG